MNGLQLCHRRTILKKKIYTIALWLLSLIFFSTISLWLIFSTYHKKQLKNQALTYETFQNKLLKENSWNDTSDCKSTSQKKSNKKKKLLKIKNSNAYSGLAEIPDVDFNSLKKYNNDIYAWIQIPKINISYPVLQHEKLDYYYLTHNIDNSFGYPGCIFSETNSKKNFSDALTVLYDVWHAAPFRQL